MDLKNIRVGLAITGSFCTFNRFIDYIKLLKQEVLSVIPIISESVAVMDTKFNTVSQRKELLSEITHSEIIMSINDAERIGPEKMFDILVVAPCTGNTMAKISHGITDGTVTMAVKSHLRNNSPVVLGISSNDILGANAVNLGGLLNTKNIYFIPFFQDDPVNKEKSITFNEEKLLDTIKAALNGKQIQPLINPTKA